MAEPLDAPLDRSEPLGIKNPLLPPRALGQTEPNLQFMLPLGARPLAVLDPSIFFPEGGSEYAEIGQSFAESPFFDTPKPTSQIDHQSESTATAFSQNTPIQRQTVSLDSPAPLPLENQLIRVQEQQAQVQSVDASEPTRVTGASVDSPILPDEPIANESVSSEIAPTADLEASIQRSQLSPGEPPLLAQTASEPTSLPGNRESFQTSPSDLDPPQLLTKAPALKRGENSSSTDTSIQTQLVSSQSEAAPSSPKSPAVEASTGATEPVTEALQKPSGLGEAPAISTESGQQTQTSQPDVISSVSESAIASTIQRQAIPEQPQSNEREEVEAIPAQTNLPQEAESSTIRQATEGMMPLGESPSYQQPSQPPIQNITGLEDSATSLLSSDSQSQETPQSIAPIIQAYPASVSPLEQAVQPEVPELSTTELQAEAFTDLPRQANTANVPPSTPNPPETTGNPTLVEPVEDVPTTSPELTTSTEQETIQPRFESASLQSETTSPPLLDLPSEVVTEVSHQAIELSSPETVQRAAESVQEPTNSQLPTIGDEVEKVRSHSPLEHPLLSPAQPSDAVLPSTVNSDSLPSALELTPSVPTQNTSPPASIPTAETEAIVQPELDSTSATPASATELSSLLDTSEVQVRKSPEINAPMQESSPVESPTHLEEASVQPQLEATPAPLTEVAHVSSIQEPLTGEVENTAITAEPQQSDSSGLTIEPQLTVSDLVSADSKEQPTATEAPTLQPLLESTTVQRQVTDAPALDQPVSSPQSTIQAKEADFTDFQTAPEIIQEPSSQSSAPEEGTVQREEEAIAPITDSSSATTPVSPFTTEKTPTSVLHTQPTDGLTATEPDLIQPFQQTASTNLNTLPTLPTVLQDLSVLDSLGSTPLIQTASLADMASPNEPVPVIARKQSNVFDNAESGVEQFPTSSPAQISSSSLPSQSVLQTAPTSSNTGVVADVPTEWSSIAELLNGSSFSVPSPSAQASPPFPDLQPFGSTETVIQPQFESATRRTSADTIPTIQTDEEQSNVTEVTSETEPAADASPEQIEKLAREIYSLVRQRFKIEQERSGNSYSGRLPW
ncbi:MAG: hypothetical protein KME25_28780 [Symplocastrum torsivum CPER-KK1]|jgi:hypothetical protein|uniref:Uncharacterized protein n=1 Tax=Symplocastrum torsivum CPER-KK1 TaxID=450513 RepID=A0A951UCM6_9CYAN|nr:hypothetical protein [Symplocastrum torsivum CPER-KK1]